MSGDLNTALREFVADVALGVYTLDELEQKALKTLGLAEGAEPCAGPAQVTREEQIALCRVAVTERHYFQVTAPSLSGSYTMDVADEYRRDPLAFVARRLGTDKRQYLAYLTDLGRVTCNARTKGGRPCRNAIGTGYDFELSFAEWSGLMGWTCWTHDGIAPNKARFGG